MSLTSRSHCTSCMPLVWFLPGPLLFKPQSPPPQKPTSCPPSQSARTLYHFLPASLATLGYPRLTYTLRLTKTTVLALPFIPIQLLASSHALRHLTYVNTSPHLNLDTRFELTQAVTAIDQWSDSFKDVYCVVCLGPLSPHYLRKFTYNTEETTRFKLFDDGCGCVHRSTMEKLDAMGVPEHEEDSDSSLYANSEPGSRRWRFCNHDLDCKNGLWGYDGTHLTEDDIAVSNPPPALRPFSAYGYTN